MICLYEKSCGAIIYRNSGSETEYLLLFQHKSQTWSFPKGHCEPLEIEEQTACREVFEETGMKVAIKQGFYESVSYPIREKATKYVHLYIAKATGDIEIWRDEIEKYIWANKSESIKLLPKVGYDELLNKAEMFLQNNE
ncbi:MAG: NUDIX domain-containing protein [Bacillota bacterium]|nr:NUDIX domain-containing protein [Bacillota bacterium]